MCGIYKITNLINQKVYIGQSLNIQERWRKHLIIKDSSAIHLALQKYGKDCFSFEVIEECEPKELCEREKYWIKLYNSQTPNGYNLNEGGYGGNSRSVQCFDEKANFIKEFSSIVEAAEEMGVSPAKITACCSENSRFFAGEYQWKYTDDNKIITPKKKRKTQSVYQFDLKGNLINEYESITHAAESVKLDKSKICACCKGRQKTSGGFQWSYNKTCLPLNPKHQKRKVGQYNLEGELVAIYNTLTEAAKAVNGSPGGVGAVCLGHSKTCKGYIFKYLDT